MELLISISIAAIVLVSVGVAQSVCYDLNRTSLETEAGTADLESAMESILLLTPDEIADEDGLYAEDLPIAAFENLHLKDERIVASYPNRTGTEVPDPLEIRLTLTFEDYAGRARSMAIGSLKAR